MVHESLNEKLLAIGLPDIFAWRVFFWECGNGLTVVPPGRECESYVSHGT